MLERRILINNNLLNGYEYVDLGLPSGLLWGKCNIGSEEETEVGLYFQWGNIIGRTLDDGYSFYTSEYYSTTPGSSLTGDIPVNTTYDAARAIWGGDWRMPERSEIVELINNTIHEWTDDFNGTGQAGRVFYKKDSNNLKVLDTYIFLPSSGRLMNTGKNGTYSNMWSSTVNGTGSGYCGQGPSSYFNADYGNYKYIGLQIRPCSD